ncbi:MAG: N-acetylneuraminate lyase [Treponema sp.]|nr:N-acetylneuraminate lyase [Treponema sp.]
MVKKEPDKKAIYSALVTPFNKNAELDVAVLKKLIRFQLDKGIEGFYCCGSSGEALLLSNDERKKIVEVVLGEVGGQVPVIAHVGSLNTWSAVDLAKHAEKCGISAVSAIPPIYYHYSQAEINQYYKDIADAVSVGVIVYNIPQFTGISFTNANPLLQDKRIIGIKHTSMNLYDLERIGHEYPDKMLINGFDEIFASAMAAGATATIGTMVNVCPKLFMEIRKAFNAGDVKEAHRLQSRLNNLVEVFVNTSVFPAAKYAVTLQGIDVGSCRKPFIPLTEEQKNKVKAAMNEVADII